MEEMPESDRASTSRRPPFAPSHRISFRSATGLSPIVSGWVGKIPVQWGDNPLLIFHTSGVFVCGSLWALRSNILSRESGERGWVLVRFDADAEQAAHCGLHYALAGRDLSDTLLHLVTTKLKEATTLPPAAFIEMDTL